MADNKNENTAESAQAASAAEKPNHGPAQQKAGSGSAAATPGQNNAKSAKTDKASKSARSSKVGKKDRLLLKFILIAIPVLLIAICVGFVIYNFFGARDILGGWLKDPLIKTVTWLDPEFSAVDDELRSMSDERIAQADEREAALDGRETELDIREAEMDKRDAGLNDREKQLDRRSTSLDKREADIAQEESKTVPISQRVLTDDELSSYQSLGRMYANMDPEAAAKILTDMTDPYDSATILYHMSERAAAAVLAAMNVGLAARLTELMLE